ncbi:MAG: hypothetical protein J6M27_12680 [Lachnospiraceae bacterium]|nr:hypothetical protein [Lachnospiraceae bacterium]
MSGDRVLEAVGYINPVYVEDSEKVQNIKIRSGIRTIQRLAVAAIVFILVSSITAFAAWYYLSAWDVAEKSGDGKLAEAFGEDIAWAGEEVQSYGGYDVSLIGLVSGEDISDHLTTYDGELVSDSTYAVVAISNSDGTPMPDTSGEEYGETDFLVSPYFEGFDPARYNILSLEAGGYVAIVDNGIQYRLVSVENIEAFANHTIYLGVSEGTFYNRDAYVFDEESGKISRNESYIGLNALFTLPVDHSKADGQKVAEIVDKIDNPIKEDNSDDPYVWVTDDVREFMSKLTINNIDTYAEPIKSTIQILVPDENGNFSYRYELPKGASGSGTYNVKVMFPDGKPGMYDQFGWSASENGLEDLIIETYTLNEDCTVTFAIYVPKSYSE